MNTPINKQLSSKSAIITYKNAISNSFYLNNEENTSNKKSKENQIIKEKKIK